MPIEPPAADPLAALPDTRSTPAGAPSADRGRQPIDSRTLLAGRTEVRIAHRGELYRLRQTALGKLILTK
jgi:hemin uptake protein HemP